MSERFTKGPWTFENHSPEVPLLGVYAPDNKSPWHFSRTNEEAAANARLIAAAPELLEALEKGVSEAEQAEFERWLSKEAPSGDCEAVHRQWEESAIFLDFHNWWGGAIAAIAKARGES